MEYSDFQKSCSGEEGLVDYLTVNSERMFHLWVSKLPKLLVEENSFFLCLKPIKVVSVIFFKKEKLKRWPEPSKNPFAIGAVPLRNFSTKSFVQRVNESWEKHQKLRHFSPHFSTFLVEVLRVLQVRTFFPQMKNILGGKLRHWKSKERDTCFSCVSHGVVCKSVLRIFESIFVTEKKGLILM